jgi:hypothetical protein
MKFAGISDLQVQGCNRWTLPDGTIKLALPHVLPFFRTIAANSVITDNEFGTPPDYDFLCKVVSWTGFTPKMTVQIQWPDGRYLSNPGLDFFSFVGVGRRGRLISPHKFCAKSSKIRLNLDNTANVNDYSIELYFEGVILVDILP